jgi:hypothetical protein
MYQLTGVTKLYHKGHSTIPAVTGLSRSIRWHTNCHPAQPRHRLCPNRH